MNDIHARHGLHRISEADHEAACKGRDSRGGLRSNLLRRVGNLLDLVGDGVLDRGRVRHVGEKRLGGGGVVSRTLGADTVNGGLRDRRLRSDIDGSDSGLVAN